MNKSVNMEELIDYSVGQFKYCKLFTSNYWWKI